MMQKKRVHVEHGLKVGNKQKNSITTFLLNFADASYLVSTPTRLSIGTSLID